MAQQALTVQSITGGRFVLGIGLSHQPLIEGSFGYSFEKPIRHMREYLDALLPLVREGSVQAVGETITAGRPSTCAGRRRCVSCSRRSDPRCSCSPVREPTAR